MTHRERALAAFRFEQPDRVPCDLMEASVWSELMDYFRERYGLQDGFGVLNHLDTDFRFLGMTYHDPSPKPPEAATPPEAAAPPEPREIYTNAVTTGPLADARTIADVEAHKMPDPACFQAPDFAGPRRTWPDHALVFSAGWMPLFWGACEAFGMEEALVKLVEEPQVFEAFVRRRHEFYMDVLSRGLEAARGHLDICWLGDDFAGQEGMIVSPELWRRHVKPYLAEQVRLAREHDMFVLYHSCGAVRPVLGDLIDIGVNALLVFQTTAAGMDAESVAAEFGGRLAFYGGIDVQQLLSYGTVDEVKAEVRRNVAAFADCGGYVVANSHHGVRTIRGENVEAMCEAARECTFPS